MEPSTRYSQDLDLDLSWAISILRRRSMEIASIMMVALGAAALAILFTPPVYTASAVLLLETQPPGLFRSNSVFSERIDPPIVDTQVEVLRSSQLILKVIDDMKLLENPEFRPDELTIPSPVEVLREGKDWISDKLQQTFGDTAPGTAAANLGDDPRRAVLAQVLKQLVIARVGNSNTIQISYSSKSPATAAAIVNRLATVYITAQLAWTPENAAAVLPEIEDRVIITKASPPPFPSGPRKALILVGALLVGLFASLATAFAREWLDESLQSPEQIERITTVRCIATLPRATIKHHEAKAPLQPKSFTSACQPIIADVLANPVSAFSDGIRRLAVCVQNIKTSQNTRIVAVSSVADGDGKTTIAASVALLLAQTQGSTLLIDADLRGRGATRLLAPEASLGLRDCVNGTFPLPVLLWADANSPLRFLPSIVTGLPEHPADILTSPGMDQLLRQAGKTFRNIVIDLPALGTVIDVQALIPSVDALFLVVAKDTAANELSKAMADAPAIREKLSGTILNKA